MIASRPLHRFGIVIALDLSEYAEIVLEHAFDQAARHAATDLHVLVVAGRDADLDATKKAMAALVLPALENVACSDWTATLHVRSGRIHEEVIALAAELRAGLIVIGRFGLHRGSTIASRVIEDATCPTLVVGLTDDSPDSIEACELCVATRAESAGERWFCDEHSARDRQSLASVTLASGTWTGGGLLW